MHTQKTWHKDRVGIFLDPHTRNRLNKLKSDLSLQTQEFYSQSDVIKMLIDHYEQTTPQEHVPA